jgi:hypothetical protein
MPKNLLASINKETMGILLLPTLRGAYKDMNIAFYEHFLKSYGNVKQFGLFRK